MVSLGIVLKVNDTRRVKCYQVKLCLKKIGSLKESFILKIAQFSLNQVSLENLGVRLPLRFQKHTSLSIFTWLGESPLWATGNWSPSGTLGGIFPFWIWIGGRQYTPPSIHPWGLVSGIALRARLGKVVQFCSPSFLALSHGHWNCQGSAQ